MTSPRRPLTAVLLTAVLLAAVLPVRADIVDDIDVARVELPDRSEASLAAARREGMRQVLVKLSGTRETLKETSIAQALREAQRYLVSYSYETGATPGSPAVRLQYDGDALRTLLREAGQPLWTTNRPTVLAWLIGSDGARRRFASPEAAPALRDALGEAFARRGVPLQQPLYDLEDADKLSPGAAWRQSSSALAAASARYRDTEVLAGRVALLSDGNWIGDWRFLDRGRWLVRPVTAGSMAAFVDEGADLAATALAARYAVVGDTSSELQFSILVEGIQAYAQYSNLQTALAAIEVIDRVIPERVTPQQVLLRVESAAQQQQLERIIALDARFVPVSGAVTDGQLHYRWEE